MTDKVFGPVPSRRLGRSLGINNIPPKICSYGCVYCQLGRTIQMRVDRQPFYDVDDVLACVRDRVDALASRGEKVDFLTLVPDGEPTLDVGLGALILGLKSLGIPVAVISNASLLWDEAVRVDLMPADWVSVKVDTVDETLWHTINRPHGSLSHTRVLEGIQRFAGDFRGELVTETMLVHDVNVDEPALSELARFLVSLHPGTAYLSIPTRPPAEVWVQPPARMFIDDAYLVFSSAGLAVRMLTGYEGSEFSSTGSAKTDLLSITAVHPLREDALLALLEKTGEDWAVVQRLLDGQMLVEKTYGGHRFFLRRFER